MSDHKSIKQDIKQKCNAWGEDIVLMQFGATFDIVDENAEYFHKEFGFKFNSSTVNFLSAGFSVHAIEKYKKQLLKRKIKFCIVEQTSKDNNGHIIREVTYSSSNGPSLGRRFIRANKNQSIKYKVDGKDREFENVSDYMEAIKNSKTQFNAYSHWTEEEDKELLKLLNSEMSIKEIAHHLKRTYGSISSRKSKLESHSFFVAKMDENEENIKRFIKALSEGVNPLTGEMLDENSAWLHPAILKDLKSYFQIDDL